MQLPIQRLLNRTTWLKIHLYLAVIAGFFFALIGLTGSISVYREELDELLNPQLVIEQPSGKRQSLDKIMAAVHAAHPDRLGSWTLEMPRSPHSMITAWYDKPRETFFEWYAPLMVSVNPYTAEVVANRFWGQTAATWLLDLHTQLHLGRFGRNAVGILSLLLIVSAATGVYLWWPSAWEITPVSNRLTAYTQSLALTIRRNISLMGLAFDLHRLTGLLSALILLLLAFTGLQLSYPSLLAILAGSSGMEHGETGRNIVSTAVPNNHPVGLESAEFVARGPFPHAELRRVTTPAGDSGIYRINLRQNNEINRRHPYTTVWVDRWSGQIKEVRDPSGFTSGEVVTSWIWPLHTGEALGSTGRLLWFLSGMGLFILYVSGVLRWLHRRGKVKDREMNLAELGPLFYRLQDKFYRTGSALLQLSIALLHKVKLYTPHVIKSCTALMQWLHSMITNRPKRLERK